MIGIHDKWLVRAFVLGLVLVAVAAIVIGSGKLADVVAGLIVVGLAASWVVTRLRRQETCRFLPGVIALALFWSVGLLALFAWQDTPPSRPAAKPAGFVPNGTGRIAFAESRDIYVMNADGTGEARLTGDEYGGHWPAWSPAGDRLAFESEGEVYVMNADGTNPTRLTNSLAASNSRPLWSPDGQRIAFLSDRSGTWDAYVMNADGTHQTRLTDLGSPSSSCNNPLWSPDGQQIAFLSGLNGTNIYVMDADGTNQTRIRAYQSFPAPNYVTIQHFVWSPDGKHIAFDADGAEQDRPRRDQPGPPRIRGLPCLGTIMPLWSRPSG